MSEFDAGIASKVFPICQGNFREIHPFITCAELLEKNLSALEKTRPNKFYF